MPDKTDDEELAQALRDHEIRVGDPPAPEPEVAPSTDTGFEAEEKPEEKLPLSLNVEDFQIDVPPLEGI